MSRENYRKRLFMFVPAFKKRAKIGAQLSNSRYTVRGFRQFRGHLPRGKTDIDTARMRVGNAREDRSQSYVRPASCYSLCV
jgi:hypothetical protein